MGCNRTRMRKRLDCLFVVMFAVFAAGGPGLHHAPIFSVHGGCCAGHLSGRAHSCSAKVPHTDSSIQPTESSCCCHHEATTSGFDLQWQNGQEPPLESSHPCWICEFFLIAAGEIQPPTCFMKSEVAFLITPPCLAVVAEATGFCLARGPPSLPFVPVS